MASERDSDARLETLERRRREAIRKTFTRLDPVALGAGTGVLAAVLIGAATARVLVSRTDDGLEYWLGLLSQYFHGYDINWVGAAWGVLWFFVVGFALGFLIAAFRNMALRFVLWKMSYDAARWRRRHFLDEI